MSMEQDMDKWSIKRRPFFFFHFIFMVFLLNFNTLDLKNRETVSHLCRAELQPKYKHDGH